MTHNAEYEWVRWAKRFAAIAEDELSEGTKGLRGIRPEVQAAIDRVRRDLREVLDILAQIDGSV